ncbi:MAG: tRNA (adenosine(37)-N6)-threonylcarbamoyltransferase complex dimerization subunit type 1 TsaB [Terriglobia bacterium]
MWLLAIDTSTRDASVALLHDDRLVALVATPGDEQHSVRLFRDIERALAAAELKLADINVYAVANGPGAFTALRVGLTAIKGLAELHAKPIVAVSVLEAVCQSTRAQGLLVPVVNAYRGQIFGGVYEKTCEDIVRREPERVLTLEEFFAALTRAGLDARAPTLVSPHLARFASRLAQSPFGSARREQTSPVLADAVAWRARAKLAHGQMTDALRLEANYVRRSDAELLWKPK